ESLCIYLFKQKTAYIILSRLEFRRVLCRSYNPAQSPLFEALAGEAALRPLVEALRAACLLEPEAVPPLAAVLGGTAPTVRRTRPIGRASCRDRGNLLMVGDGRSTHNRSATV